jgi:hypothetical protein
VINDPFESAADSPIAPAERCFAIIPDDAAELPLATKAIYVGGGGSVTLRSVRGTADVVFARVPDGTILDVRVAAVRATGTTATDIVGLA